MATQKQILKDHGSDLAAILKQVKADNPDLSHKEAMKIAMKEFWKKHNGGESKKGKKADTAKPRKEKAHSKDDDSSTDEDWFIL